MPTGYSLIELVVVIVIVGIIATVGIRSLHSAGETAKAEETKKELDQLAWAVAGRPDLRSGGQRIDFGYVGDVGSLPPNLDALVTNPGGYTTWAGPYIRDEFQLTDTSASSEFKADAWGDAYTYSGGIMISSTGSGSTITRQIASSVDDLLRNTVSTVITDLDHTPPGNLYRDSVSVVLTYPDGAGALTTRTQNPSANGYVIFDSIPIGSHQLQIVYVPDNDTLRRRVMVEPGSACFVEVNLFKDAW